MGRVACRLQLVGLQRVEQGWSDLAHTHALIYMEAFVLQSGKHWGQYLDRSKRESEQPRKGLHGISLSLALGLPFSSLSSKFTNCLVFRFRGFWVLWEQMTKCKVKLEEVHPHCLWTELSRVSSVSSDHSHFTVETIEVQQKVRNLLNFIQERGTEIWTQMFQTPNFLRILR